jgi:hypothetical protein
MGYGGNGKYYDSEMEYLLDPMTPKEKADKKEMDANETSGDFQSRFGAIAIKPVVQEPEKLAGALKSSAGIEPPAEAPKAETPSRFSILNTFRGMAAGAEDSVKNIGENFAKGLEGIRSTFAAPGDVLSGKIQPGSIQEIEKAADLAMLMVGGPAPVAAKAADGSLGSFMGVRSKTINKDKLYKAQEMEMNAAHPDEIWGSTGTFRGSDGRWRQEIDDSTARLKDDAFDKTIHTYPDNEDLLTYALKPQPKDFFGAKKPVTLDKVLDHPELFKAYPHLKNIKVEPLPTHLSERNVIGQMAGDTLYLRDDLHPSFAQSVLLHEIQHSIQHLEGFAQGGNALEFLPKELPKAKQEFEKTRDEVMSIEILKLKHPEDYKRMVNIVKSEKLIEEAEIEAHTSYKRLMGEVEARNVQTRMMFNKLSRKTSPPKSTEDVPRFRQLGNEGEYQMK